MKFMLVNHDDVRFIYSKKRTLDPGPEAFIIRLCGQVFHMNTARRCVQRPTLSTSAGEQTVVATVP